MTQQELFQKWLEQVLKEKTEWMRENNPTWNIDDQMAYEVGLRTGFIEAIRILKLQNLVKER